MSWPSRHRNACQGRPYRDQAAPAWQKAGRCDYNGALSRDSAADGGQGEPVVRPEIGTGDIVVGMLAALGVVVLIALFVWVLRDRMMKK